jgi:hypothetical protein
MKTINFMMDFIDFYFYFSMYIFQTQLYLNVL